MSESGRDESGQRGALVRQQTWALLLIWLVPALWAVNYIVARKAPGVVEPYALALGRWAVACAVLLTLCGRSLWRRRQEWVAAWWQYAVLGFFGMLVCGAWVYEGARTTQAMNISLIYSASPVLIAIGSVLWLGERLRLRQLLGVALAIAGVLHVVAQGQWNALAQVQWVVGDAWIVAATIAWALYALLQKIWPSTLGATERLALISLGGVAVLLPCALWEISRPSAVPWSWAATGLCLLAGLVPGIGAYWIYGWAQKILGASRVAVTLYLGPLYAAVAAYGVLGEPLGWHHLVGAALILPGVYWVSRSSSRGG